MVYSIEARRLAESLRPCPSLCTAHIHTYTYIRVHTRVCVHACKESERGHARTKGIYVHTAMAFGGRTRGVGRYTLAKGEGRGAERERGTRSRGACGEPEIIGMSGPRDMNQAEQTLNLEIRCRRTKATYRWQKRGGRGSVPLSKYTFAITILDSPNPLLPFFSPQRFSSVPLQR